LLAPCVALAHHGREVLLDEVERGIVDVAVAAADVDVVDARALRDPPGPFDVEDRLETVSATSGGRGAGVRDEGHRDRRRGQAELGAERVDVALGDLGRAHDADRDARAVELRPADAGAVELVDVVRERPVRGAEHVERPTVRPAVEREAHLATSSAHVPRGSGHRARIEVVRVVQTEHHVGERVGERGRGRHRVVRLPGDDVTVHLGLERGLEVAHAAREADSRAEAGRAAHVEALRAEPRAGAGDVVCAGAESGRVLLRCEPASELGGLGVELRGDERVAVLPLLGREPEEEREILDAERRVQPTIVVLGSCVRVDRVRQAHGPATERHAHRRGRDPRRCRGSFGGRAFGRRTRLRAAVRERGERRERDARKEPGAQARARHSNSAHDPVLRTCAVRSGRAMRGDSTFEVGVGRRPNAQASEIPSPR